MTEDERRCREQELWALARAAPEKLLAAYGLSGSLPPRFSFAAAIQAMLAQEEEEGQSDA